MVSRDQKTRITHFNRLEHSALQNDVQLFFISPYMGCLQHFRWQAVFHIFLGLFFGVGQRSFILFAHFFQKNQERNAMKKRVFVLGLLVQGCQLPICQKFTNGRWLENKNLPILRESRMTNPARYLQKNKQKS
jgi:hypothetical protein